MDKIPDDKVIMAKEAVDYFAQQQISICYAYARRMFADCPHVIRRRYVRAGDLWSWWCLNPGWRAFPRRPAGGGDTRGLAETG